MVPRTNHPDFNIQLQVNQNKEFSKILHSSFQDVGTRSISLKPGYEYKIEIIVDGQVSTEGFQNLPLEQRKCRLQHEIEESSIFKIYTQSNCIYECHVKKASEYCQCVPWDFLHNLKNRHATQYFL